MINYLKLSNLKNVNILRLKQIIQILKSSDYLVFSMRISSISSVCFVVVSFTAITTGLLSASSNIAIAQISEISQRETKSENLISQVNVLFVNPSIGNDTKTNGSESTPFKTITQALRVAKDNTVIRLAKGTYSTQIGEQFPLILKSGVSIQGDIYSQGKDIIITGGGDYLSRYYGSKNITIVASGKAKLAGVTVTNSNPRGYGMWIESSQPVVKNNTFTGSTQDGVAVTGKAAPQISNNYFYGNGANGITVSGKSQPQIKQNTFQDTGFGINIAQNASPQVISNKISHNRTGVVVQASSRPVLRNNSISNNKEDGLVIIAQAVPDLGNSSNPGGNQFNFNGRYDINAEAAKQEVVAYGNNMVNNKIAGKVNITATAAPVKAASQLPRRTPTLFKPKLRRENPPALKQPLPTTGTNNQEEFNYLEVEQDTIEFTAPEIASQPPANTSSSLPTLKPAPIGESALLPQNTARIPFNDTGRMNIPNPPQITASSTQINSRYRVIVDAITPREQELVKFIVPDAWSIRRGGKRVMQAGIFSSRNQANDLIRKFKNNGLKARIEPIK